MEVRGLRCGEKVHRQGTMEVYTGTYCNKSIILFELPTDTHRTHTHMHKHTRAHAHRRTRVFGQCTVCAKRSVEAPDQVHIIHIHMNIIIRYLFLNWLL